MEGLTAFVSRFDKGKPENRRTQTDTTAERDHNNIPSAPSNIAVPLPFSIAEILSEKRNGSRANQTDDPQNEIRSFNIQGKKENYSFNPLEMHVTVCYLSSR